MTDLDQRIRERLDEWFRPSGEAPPEFTTPADIDPEQARVIQAAWDAIMANTPRRHEIVDLPPSPFDLMRRAILAVLDLHKPRGTVVAAKTVYDCEHCRDTNWGGPDVAWPCETVAAIAEALGIEVGGE